LVVIPKLAKVLIAEKAFVLSQPNPREFVDEGINLPFIAGCFGPGVISFNYPKDGYSWDYEPY